MEILALIPARGGSKSIPRKNIKKLYRHPLIAYSIASALVAETVTRTIVSTDDQEISSIAKSYGAETPFLRPGNLAEDDTPDLPVFQHALKWLDQNENYRPDIIIQLRPTTPLRPQGLIDEAVNIYMQNQDADCVRGMVDAGENPFKMWKKDSDGTFIPLLNSEFDEPYNMPRQNLPQTFWQTGHIDVIPSATILGKNSLSGNKIIPVFIDRSYCIDIDAQEDFEYAEWRLGTGKLNIDKPVSKPNKS